VERFAQEGEGMKSVQEVNSFVDYAYPTMMAEKALRALHDAALEKNWYEARQQALYTIKWATETHAALLVMEQKDK
jgi:hypothetical protein